MNNVSLSEDYQQPILQQVQILEDVNYCKIFSQPFLLNWEDEFHSGLNITKIFVDSFLSMPQSTESTKLHSRTARWNQGSDYQSL